MCSERSDKELTSISQLLLDLPQSCHSAFVRPLMPGNEVAVAVASETSEATCDY